jgi:hypothetical protein
MRKYRIRVAVFFENTTILELRIARHMSRTNCIHTYPTFSFTLPVLFSAPGAAKVFSEKLANTPISRPVVTVSQCVDTYLDLGDTAHAPLPSPVRPYNRNRTQGRQHQACVYRGGGRGGGFTISRPSKSRFLRRASNNLTFFQY